MNNKICTICQKIFIKIWRNQKYCSEKCYIQSRQKFCIDCNKKLGNYRSTRCFSCEAKRRHKEGIFNSIGENNPNWQGKNYHASHYCKDCGKKVSKTSYYGFGRCKQCCNKGKLNGNYIDGSSYEDYPAEFTESLKESIRKRDEYTCQNCDMTQEEHFIVYGRNLHIHHVDYNRNNCKYHNLLTLCQGCNIRANYNRAYWKNNFIQKIKAFTYEK
jgi:hypothetical protein